MLRWTMGDPAAEETHLAPKTESPDAAAQLPPVSGEEQAPALRHDSAIPKSVEISIIRADAAEFKPKDDDSERKSAPIASELEPTEVPSAVEAKKKAQPRKAAAVKLEVVNPFRPEEYEKIELFGDEYQLPLGFVCQGLVHATRDDFVKRSCFDFLLTALFVAMVTLANPVASVFEVHDAISRALVRAETIAPGNATRTKRDFYSIKNQGEFWMWATDILYPTVYGTASSSKGFTVARYNQLISPIRFRQVKLKNGGCGFPESNHGLARPCWSSFEWPNFGTLSNFGGIEVDDSPIGSTNSSAWVEGMPTLLGEQEDFTTSYGTSGHIVDLDLDPVTAMSKLENMKRSRWTSEATQIVAVEMNTYNANYDLTTVFRFVITQSTGGKLLPRVDTCSCRLKPYPDAASAVGSAEAVWAFLFLIYTFMRTYWWCQNGIRRSFQKTYSWIQLLNIVWLSGFIALWLQHGTADHTMFQSRHAAVFHDLYSTCHIFNVAANFASLTMVLASIQLATSLKVYPGFLTVYRVLGHSVSMVVPYVFVIACGTFTFALSAMWMFGERIEGLHTWYHAIGLLSHSLAVGKQTLYVYDQMVEGSAAAAGIWMVLFILVVAFIWLNMIVSLVTSSMQIVSRQRPLEENLMRSFPVASFKTYLMGKVPWLWRDPDTMEPVKRLLLEEAAWREHLKYIDVEKLQDLVGKLVPEGKRVLQLADIMTLFLDEDEERSYRTAATWAISISRTLGVSMEDPQQKRSLLFEADLLTQGVSSLEEEVYGLGLQLRRTFPKEAPRAKMV